MKGSRAVKEKRNNERKESEMRLESS